MSTATASSPSTPLQDLLGKFSLLPRADIILRSSDSHDFRVQKLYVVDSSPILGEQIMATTCHSVGPEATSEASCDATTVDDEAKDEPLLPVVQLAESHAIISSLLTFVFPVLPVLPPTIEQILELLSVAEKYEMSIALIRIRDCAARRDPPFICPETALHIYSLARNHGLLQETLGSAEETLKSPMTIQDLEDKFDIMPSVALYELWQYRQQVLECLELSEVCQIMSNLDCVEISEFRDIPLWLDQYLDTVVQDPACVDLTTFHLALSSHISLQDPECCDHCTSISSETISEFWTALTAAFRESTRTAESDFSFSEGKIRFQGSTSAIPKASHLPEGLDMRGADVILRSSDLVSFRVHKSILAISSPFFHDMFCLPQPLDSEVVDGLPIVHVSEDAEILHSLLTALYPITSVIPDSYEKGLALLAASQKYHMDTVLSTLRLEIGRHLPTTEAAFRVYAIASGKQLIPEMESAARLTLNHPMTFEAIGNALSLFEGSALSDLIRFRKRCHGNLLSFFGGFVNGSDSISKIWVDCPKTKHSRSDKITLSGWIVDFIRQYTESLEETYVNTLIKPSSLRKEFVKALRTHISSKNCSSCATLYAMEGEAFHDRLYRRISKARDNEPFRLDAGASNTSEVLKNPNA